MAQEKILGRQELAEHIGRLISSSRNKTHGDPHEQFDVAQSIKGIIRGKLEGRFITLVQSEALEQILTKISRIACGDSNHIDTWLDIAGYALIAAESCEPPSQDSNIVDGLEEISKPILNWPQRLEDLPNASNNDCR